MMSGYWNDPEATSEALEEGWMHTGDLARQDEQGFYYFVGRSKDMIVRDSSNVGPGEIEDALCRHPAVRRCGVVGVPDDVYGQAIHAFVVLDPLADPCPAPAELESFAAERLSARKVPSFWSFVSELPLTAAGKIDRKALRELART